MNISTDKNDRSKINRKTIDRTHFLSFVSMIAVNVQLNFNAILYALVEQYSSVDNGVKNTRSSLENNTIRVLDSSGNSRLVSNVTIIRRTRAKVRVTRKNSARASFHRRRVKISGRISLYRGRNSRLLIFPSGKPSPPVARDKYAIPTNIYKCRFVIAATGNCQNKS